MLKMILRDVSDKRFIIFKIRGNFQKVVFLEIKKKYRTLL